MPPEIKPPTAAEIEQALKDGLVSNPELGNALREFEAKESNEIPTKQKTATKDETPGMVKLVYKLSGGSIAEQHQAEYVLLGFIIVATLVSAYLFFSISGESSPSAADPLMLQLHPELVK